MTTTDHKVLVTFEADASELKNAMGQVTKDLKKLHTQTGNVQKRDLKYTKESQKINEKQSKLSKTALPTQIKQIKQVTRELDLQNKALTQQLALYKKINAQIRTGQPVVSAPVPAPPTGRGGRGGRGAGRGRGAAGGAGGGAGERPSTVETDPLFGGRSLNQFATGLVKGVVGAGVGALFSLLSMPFAAIGAEYEAFRSYASQLPKLAGYAGEGINIGLAPSRRESGELSELRRGAGAKLGFSPEEVISTVVSTMRATGGERTGPASGGAESAMVLSRLLGLDPTQVAGMFGGMRQAGMTGFAAGGDAYKALTKAISLGMVSGLEKARLPEFLQGVMSLTEAAAGREAGDVSMEPFARLLAQLGRTGLSGLQGERGANVARALEEGFTRPGGGEEGMALALSSMGFGRLGPGGGTDYYTARRNLELGTTAENPEFIQDMMRTVNAAYGGNRKESNMAIQSMLGGSLTLAQIEAVQAAMARGEEPGEVSAMLEEMTESEKDILADIRDLLSGNPEALREAARSARLANENVDLGSQLAASLESMHETLRRFVNDTAPGILSAVTSISDTLRRLEPVFSGLASVMNLVLSAGAPNPEFDVEDLPEEVRGTAAAERLTETPITMGPRERARRGLEPIAERDWSEVLEWAFTMGQDERDAMEALRDMGVPTEDIEEFRRPTFASRYTREEEARAVTDWLTTVGAEAPSVREAVPRTSTVDSILTSLESRLSSMSGRPDYGARIDTREELNTVLAFLVANNVQVSPSLRALLDTRGGTE